jgi:hypothetical protein
MLRIGFPLILKLAQMIEVQLSPELAVVQPAGAAVSRVLAAMSAVELLVISWVAMALEAGLLLALQVQMEILPEQLSPPLDR